MSKSRVEMRSLRLYRLTINGPTTPAQLKKFLERVRELPEVASAQEGDGCIVVELRPGKDHHQLQVQKLNPLADRIFNAG